ncbi:MAG: 50S ribosome-binding GTPase [Oscillospiraceae bacterium]|nr:50S ribosome-binding GTPase [Oscillospiraceae bacterium]
MNDTLETAVLVIGKTGTGKSSLLNYIFGHEVEKTGAGKPVTESGFYEHVYKLKEDFHIKIYDSWGLEANKSREWLNKVESIVKEHDRLKISEWFNTIIFCISANNSRVEPFEKDIIRQMYEDKNNIVVALTHCDSPNLSENEGMVREILKTGIPRDRIINVSSVEGETLGGTKTEQFGKDELFTAIINNLWVSICGKLPKQLKSAMHKNLEQSRSRQIKLVKRKINVLSKIKDSVFVKANTPSPTLDDLNQRVTEEIQDFSDNELKKIKLRLNQANVYYFQLYRQFNQQISEANRLKVIIPDVDLLEGHLEDINDVLNSEKLHNVADIAAKILRVDLSEVNEVIKETLSRIAINMEAIGKMRKMTIKKINSYYDELKLNFDHSIDDVTNKISTKYEIALEKINEES